MTLTVKNLNKQIDRQAILEHIGFSVSAGEIVGLIGRNGTGKTTLFRTIANHYAKDSGIVSINGINIDEQPESYQEIFYLDTQHLFIAGLTPKQIAAYYRLFFEQFDTEKYFALLKKHQLAPDLKFQRFSKGMQALISVITAFSSNASYILLDEPFDGLDIIIKKQVMRLVLNEVSTHQRGIIISSHNLPELEDIIDHVLILKNQTLVRDYYLERIRETSRKFQMVFRKKEVPAVIKENCRIIQVQGRVIIGIFEDMTEELQREILQLEPALFEEMPITLEDLFAANLTKDSDYVLFDK